MAEPLLQIERLTKKFRTHFTYRPILAVKDVSFTVLRGESFGFLGHNGAGKTTTMKCIVGLIRPTSGSIALRGRPLVSAAERSNLGFLPEQPYFYDYLSVRETMEMFASLLGLSGKRRELRITHCAELFGLGERMKSNVRTLSKGLQQRLGLAQAVLGEPELLLLDEPFSGLDPAGRREVRQALLDLKRMGTTIFMSSHILSDVADLCDRVAIMARGSMKAVFALEDVPRLFGEAFELRLTYDHGQAPSVSRLHALADEQQSREMTGGFRTAMRFNNYLTAQRALGEAASLGLQIDGFEKLSPSLEDVFMKVTQDAASAAGEGQR